MKLGVRDDEKDNAFSKGDGAFGENNPRLFIPQEFQLPKTKDCIFATKFGEEPKIYVSVGVSSHLFPGALPQTQFKA